MSLSEKLAQAAAARARREASEAEAPRPDHGAGDSESSYALRFEDVTIDLTREVVAVHPTGEQREQGAAPADATHAAPAADASGRVDRLPEAASGGARSESRPITIDELKRRRAARFAMRPAPPSPFDTPVEPLPAPRPSVAPTPAALDEAQRQALLERLAGLRVERYLTEDDAAGPAALSAVPTGERVTELMRRRPAQSTAVATHEVTHTAADDDTATIPAASLGSAATTDAPVEQEPVVLDEPTGGDPFAGLRPNTKNLPQPRTSRLRLRRTREREPIRSTTPAQAPIPGPRCSSCGGPARIDIVDRASQRRHLSCVCCGRLWEERLDG
jgi:hypothetical protein